MKQITRTAAVEALRTIFESSEIGPLTPQDIFHRVGRDPNKVEQNNKWLQNRLTPLKYYGLVATIYKNPGRTVDKIRLTFEGRQALENFDTNKMSAPRVTFTSIVSDIAEFEKQHPSLRVQFVVTRKEQSINLDGHVS